MRAVVVMVAAGWLATATAWAAAPTAGHAGKAPIAAHKTGKNAKGPAHPVRKHGARETNASRHAGRSGHTTHAAHAKHDAVAGSKATSQGFAHTPRQAAARKPSQPAVVRPAPRHKLMVDAPAPTPAVAVKRAIPQPHELPPILS
ncbi:hypothetical protein [Paraburkholderia sp. J67]|uniref:hypothetical protein n=1 Tax=Paraburkholderia sp. J67 TaxID=2805435 RepID=UPI002ABDF648|nr:hypothetical protein [Paraburkholderia sp. J67]